MKVLALDPGRTTGVAILRDDGKIAYDQAVLDHLGLYQFLQKVDPTSIVCEEFSYRRNVHGGADLYPCELIGIVHFYIETHNLFPAHMQPASVQGKNVYFSDKLLKEYDLYLKGVEHGRSAVKHLLHWLQFSTGSSLGYDVTKLELVDFEWMLAQLYPSEPRDPVKMTT